MDSNTDTIARWLLEDEECEDIGGTEINSDTDAESEHSEHNTDSEQSDTGPVQSSQLSSAPTVPLIQGLQSTSQNNTASNNASNTIYYTGTDGTAWQAHMPRVTRTAPQNIVQKLPSIQRAYRDRTEITDCWKAFISDEMIEKILKFTNQKLQRMQQNYSRGERDCPLTSKEEIMAFFGLLYLIGIKKGNHLNTDELWCTDGTAPDIFRATMSKRRFHTLVQGIRFDDKETRDERKSRDNIAPIRDIFEQFVLHCQATYNVGAFATIDEMLEPFRGRCKFRQYIANKPAKYGIKIYAVADAKTYFTVNMEIYPAKQPNGPYKIPNDVHSVVKRVAEPILNGGRNLTMDNYYTSVPLANDLFTNHRTTVVGTLRKNKPQIPPEIVNIKGRPRCSSIFAYGKDPNKCTLVSYVPNKKSKKNVIMLSTMHKDDAIDDSTGDAFKPDIITFYNQTKSGIDVVDRLKGEYSVSRVSNRWPFTVFCGLLNLATVNGQIMFHFNTQRKLSRRLFIKTLALSLIKPFNEIRASIPTLSVALREKIQKSTGVATKTNCPREGVKAKCDFCPAKKNRYTQNRCCSCQKLLCKEHTKKQTFTCHGCYMSEDEDSQ